MTITFGWWLVPALITLVCVISIFGIWTGAQSSSCGWFDGVFEAIGSALLLIPILVSWLIYFMIF